MCNVVFAAIIYFDLFSLSFAPTSSHTNSQVYHIYIFETTEQSVEQMATASEAEEFFDPPDVLKSKIKKLAELIKQSNHCVIFTGAGISTSAGIRDFRSGINTVLETGGGAWAKNTAIKERKKIPDAKRKPIDIQKAWPTAAHLAIVQLINKGFVKYLISQNCDGLHQRSGVSKNNISELHGNSYIEICENCDKVYMRDYKVRDSLKVQNPKEHETGRKCIINNCNGRLRDTIIQFAETLPETPLELANEHSSKADLYISMGSSLQVSPACDMPKLVGTKWNLGSDKHNLVIINLQKTPLHSLCSLPIFAKIDDVMIGLMNELKIDIPQFSMQRYIQFKIQNIKHDENKKRLIITQLHEDGLNYTFLYELKFRNNDKEIICLYNNKRTNKAQDCIVDVPKWSDDDNKENDNDDKNVGLVMEMSFFGNFREPKFHISLTKYLKDFIEAEGKFIIHMTYDPTNKNWSVKSDQNDEKIAKLLKMNL